MAESNLKEMMIDDINEEVDEEIQSIENQPKLKWYLIDTERTFCKVWNFMITLITIYSLFVVPFVLVFSDVYEPEKDKLNPTLYNIELIIDIIYFIEIVLNMLKKTRAHKEIEAIAWNYLTGYFIFDAVGTIPCLFTGEVFKYYWLKAFRVIHIYRLTQPLQLVLGIALQKYSKKRQNDLKSFAGLILYVIYVCHVMACAWLYLGKDEACKMKDAAGKTIDKPSCT